MKMKKNNAFTLAEVLITLAIIGVVAALTIPTVAAKYQKQQLYTRFIKTYNTMSTVLSLAVAQEGDPETWNLDIQEPEQVVELSNKYFLPFVGNYTIGDIDKYKNGITFKALNGDDISELADSFISNNPIIFSDGTYVIPAGANPAPEANIAFFVDTNGDKGPNTLGRDMFTMYYGLNNATGKNQIFSDPDLYDGTYTPDEGCNPEGENVDNIIQGTSCLEKLVKEGKMNY